MECSFQASLWNDHSVIMKTICAIVDEFSHYMSSQRNQGFLNLLTINNLTLLVLPFVATSRDRDDTHGQSQDSIIEGAKSKTLTRRSGRVRTDLNGFDNY
ncbi:hypothetical protein CsSME_00044848 [Camellia sinensis var. sinensis]